MFAHYDKDRSEYLDKREAKALMKDCHDILSAVEIHTEPLTDEMLDRAFALTDKNNDNRITYDELLPCVQDFFVELVIFRSKNPNKLKIVDKKSVRVVERGSRASAPQRAAPSKPSPAKKSPKKVVIKEEVRSAPRTEEESPDEISEEQLEKVLDLIKSTGFQRYARQIFDENDVDNSGTIDKEEFKTLIEYLKDFIRSNNITVPRDPRPRDQVDIFAEVDMDKSGTISFDEFILLASCFFVYLKVDYESYPLKEKREKEV